MATITDLVIPYPDFQDGEIMDDAQFDDNNLAIKNKVNEIINELNNNTIKDGEVLTLTNTDVYTPTADYHPSTKVYVDTVLADAVLGTVPDNSITELKMVAAMKKQAGGVAEYDTVAPLAISVPVLEQAINVSALFGGLELDDSDRLSLWQDAQNCLVLNQHVTDSKPSIYNETYSITLNENYGKLYRSFRVLIRNGSEDKFFIDAQINSKTRDEVLIITSDYNGDIHGLAVDSSLLTNSVDDPGMGCLINGSAADYAWDITYDPSIGTHGVVDIGIAATGGTYPHVIDFYITIIGIL